MNTVKFSKLFTFIRGLLLLIVLWYIAAFALGDTLIPPPHLVVSLSFRLLLSGELFFHSLATIVRIIAGLILALITAWPIGLLISRSSHFDHFLSPLIYLLYPVPKIAFLPVFMLLFGLGDFSKIMLLYTVIVFQLTISIRDGIREIPAEFIILADTMKLSTKLRVTKLYLPASIPRILSALRISIGISMAVLFFAENYATSYGLGYFIMNGWTMINYPIMFSGILALSLTAGLLLSSIDLIQSKLCPWLEIS
jgi:ABC-type nitrate/sulfonate/bicarbonate transport system permease component